VKREQFALAASGPPKTTSPTQNCHTISPQQMIPRILNLYRGMFRQLAKITKASQNKKTLQNFVGGLVDKMQEGNIQVPSRITVMGR
jgi:hypothetical protein